MMNRYEYYFQTLVTTNKESMRIGQSSRANHIYEESPWMLGQGLITAGWRTMTPGLKSLKYDKGLTFFNVYIPLSSFCYS